MRELDRLQRFILFKLLTGELRVGVSQTLVVRALAETASLATTAIAARLMGEWTPTPEWFGASSRPASPDDDRSRPYPFFLASPLESNRSSARARREDWQVEWKWDGIRAQFIQRGGWSTSGRAARSSSPIASPRSLRPPRLPEAPCSTARSSPSRDGRPLPFSALQRRIGRKKLAQMAAGAGRVHGLRPPGAGGDACARPLAERRARSSTRLRRRAAASFGSLHCRGGLVGGSRPRARGSRARGVEGLMLKRRDVPLRRRAQAGDWWKWKIDPFTVDAVLIYAQPGGSRHPYSRAACRTPLYPRRRR